jgi:hypothetical protein
LSNTISEIDHCQNIGFDQAMVQQICTAQGGILPHVRDNANVVNASFDQLPSLEWGKRATGPLFPFDDGP